MGQVVHDYGDVCQVVAEMVRDSSASIAPEEYLLFNSCLDEAIARAVTEYDRLRVSAATLKGAEQIGVFAHEIRNLLSGVMLSFDMIREGHVTTRGSTATVVERGLQRMRDLVDRSLAEVRLEAHAYRLTPILMSDLIGDLEISAAVDAKSHGLQLAVTRVPNDLRVYGDRALLASALSNLLQNAFKFTHPNSTVILRTHATAEAAIVEVQDECGGLPEGKIEELFRPFVQRSCNRSGVGLGLMIARRAVQANRGSLYVRNLPGLGCVFTIEVPRFAGKPSRAKPPIPD